MNGAKLPLYSKILPDIHPILAAKLEQIIQATSAKIVVSSSWRRRLSIPEWNQLLQERGVTGEVVDITNSDNWDTDREGDIKEWLSRNQVDNYLILDDITMSELKSHAVETDFTTGLNDLDVITATEILNK